MHTVIQKILNLKFLPIVDYVSLKHPSTFVSTFLEQNINVLQINFAENVLIDKADEIKQLVAEFPEMSLGAGFSYSTDSAEVALANNLHFLVSGVLAEEILPVAQKYNASAILSALSPTEIYKAINLTPELVQIFPASQIPVRSVISLLDHLPQANLMLTGGLSLSTALDMLASGVKAIGVKGALFQKEHLLAEDYVSIANSLRNFKERVQKIKTPY